ncbi:MAG: transcriptional repressor NrdR [Myxococcales bacterium]|nr:transcriptional repressor NrdR [Myxococcales bacterium]
MQCPYCGGDAAVLDSRTTSEGVRRRRNCSNCKRRFTTYEKVAAPAVKVVKRSGRSETFSAEKLIKILQRVSRDRQEFGEEEATRLARSVEAQLLDAGAKSVPSSKLATMVLDLLRDMDRLSYDRLAANYMNEAGILRTTPSSSTTEGQLGLFVGEPKGGGKLK